MFSMKKRIRAIETDLQDLSIRYNSILDRLDNIYYQIDKVIERNRELIEVKPKEIKIKYFDPDIESLTRIDSGDWIDLRSAETIETTEGEYYLIRLGIGMILPDGYEAHVLPRSSTFKKYGIVMTNSTGIIDNSYSGDDDEWRFPALATRHAVIRKGDRIAQFRIVKNQPPISFDVVDHLNDTSRGGFGSTGV